MTELTKVAQWVEAMTAKPEDLNWRHTEDGRTGSLQLLPDLRRSTTTHT